MSNLKLVRHFFWERQLVCSSVVSLCLVLMPHWVLWQPKLGLASGVMLLTAGQGFLWWLFFSLTDSIFLTK